MKKQSFMTPTTLVLGVLYVMVIASLVAAGLVRSQVSAQRAPNLNCVAFYGEGSSSTTQGCDLSILKEVSVAGASFVDANSAGDAADANLGDQVVWRVSVNNTSSIDPQLDGNFIPNGGVRVIDVLPPQVAYGSYLTSDGSTYDTTTDLWEFNLGEDPVFPVTLTITTTAATNGVAENIAAFSEYECDGWCDYGDTNPENNSDSAFVSITSPQVLGDTTDKGDPQVLAASDTLAETGTGPGSSLVSTSLLAITFGVLLYGRISSKQI